MSTITISTIQDSVQTTVTLISKMAPGNASENLWVHYGDMLFRIVIENGWPIGILIIFFSARKYVLDLVKEFVEKFKKSGGLKRVTKSGVEFFEGLAETNVSPPSSKLYKDSEIEFDEDKGVEREKVETDSKDKIKAKDDNIFTSDILQDEHTRKILSTLWYHQLEHHKHFGDRWTFGFKGMSPDYHNFLVARRRLHWIGLVTTNLNELQMGLTDMGVLYCQKYEKEIGKYTYFYDDTISDGSDRSSLFK